MFLPVEPLFILKVGGCSSRWNVIVQKKTLMNALYCLHGRDACEKENDVVGYHGLLWL